MNDKMDFQPTFLRICIDRINFQNEDLAGSVCGVALKDSYPFGSVMELMLTIDECLDRIGKPQATRKTRSFLPEETETPDTFRANPAIYHTSEEIRSRRGACQTVDINIVTRYHSSWQGILYGEDGERMGMFSSDLQLLKLLQDENK